MARSRIGIWLAYSLTWSAWAQPFPFEPLKLHELVQDGAGRVWAIGRESGLQQWRDGRWHEQPVKWPPSRPFQDQFGDVPTFGGPGGAQPLILQTNVQGEAFVLWSRDGWYRNAEDIYWLSRIKGPDQLATVAFRAWLASARLTFEPGGTGWLTGGTPRIYRIGPDLTVELAHLLTGDQMYGPRSDMANPVEVLLVGNGLTWFWGRDEVFDLMTLRGVLVSRDKQFEYHDLLGDSPKRLFTCLASISTEQLWAGFRPSRGVAGPGLWEIDFRSFEAEPVAEPSRGAFSNVSEIFTVGQDRYVLANGVLWRWRDDSWRRMAARLDVMPPASDAVMRVARPVAATSQGLWIGTSGNGLLHLSADLEPRFLHWRAGQPLESVNRIIALSDGRLMLAQTMEGTTLVDPPALLAPHEVSPRVLDYFKAVDVFKRDLNGHFWGVRSGAERVLSEWDGTNWQEHPFPDDLGRDAMLQPTGLDSLGRPWLRFDQQRQAKVTILDPVHDEWSTNDSLDEALSRELRQHPGLKVELPGESRADFSADGRVCLLQRSLNSYQLQYHYYDGAEWHRWDLSVVRGDNYGGNQGMPFFTQGRPALNVWRGDPFTRVYNGRDWMTEPFRSAGDRDPANLWPTSPASPSEEGSELRDPYGLSWRISRQQLWRAGFGHSRAIFSTNEVHPFIGPQRLEEVLSDAQGNLLVRTGLPYGRHAYGLLSPRLPLPKTRLQIRPLTSDSVELLFASDDPQTIGMMWRLDESAWKDVRPGAQVRLNTLLPGKHHVEAIAFDADLQGDPVPWQNTFEIAISPEEQIRGLVAQLGASDYSQREQAARELAKRRERALPILRDARTKADSERQWWIDAVLQEIEQQQKGTPSTRNER